MLFFLIVLLVAGIGLEVYSLLDGLKRVTFTCKPETDRAEQGEPVKVSAQITNKGILPIGYIRASIAYPIAAVLPEEVNPKKEQFLQTADTVFRLWGRQQVRRSLTVHFDKRGVHYFKGAILHRGDFLGLQMVSESYAQRKQLLIYPKCLDSQTLRSAMGAYCGDMIARRHLLRDPILTMGVREYSGREAMKTISWSQTARRGQLMVREFDYTRDLSCTILLAADGMMPTQEYKLDRCCSIVRTVCQELTDRNINVDFYTNSPLLGMEHENSSAWSCTVTNTHQLELLKALALLYPAPVQCPGHQMAVAASRAAGSNTAFVIVSPFDSEQVHQMVRLLEEASGTRVLLLLESDFTEDA